MAGRWVSLWFFFLGPGLGFESRKEMVRTMKSVKVNVGYNFFSLKFGQGFKGKTGAGLSRNEKVMRGLFFALVGGKERGLF